MSTLELVISRLADIVQQSAASSNGTIESDHFGKQARLFLFNRFKFLTAGPTDRTDIRRLTPLVDITTHRTTPFFDHDTLP